MTQGTQSWCSVTNWSDMVGREVGGGLRSEGTHVYLWHMQTDVWQKNITILYGNYPPIKINK